MSPRLPDVLLWVALGVVIIGVVLEELTLFAKARQFRAEVKINGWAIAFSKVLARGLSKNLAEVGFVLLVIGLAGEVVCQAWVEGRDAHELGVADTNAADAMRQAAILGVTFNNLKVYVADQQAKVALAEATLKKSEDALDKALEKANQRVIGINKALASRTLTPVQMTHLANTLSVYPGSSVDIFVAGETKDMADLSSMLVEFLHRASWQTAVWTLTGTRGVTGIYVAIKDDAETSVRLAAEALIVELNADSLNASLLQWPGEWSKVGPLIGPIFSAKTASPMRMIIGAKPTQ